MDNEHDVELDETAAADTIVAHNPSRSEALAAMLSATATLPTPELVDFCAKAMAFIQNPTPETVGDEGANKATIATKPSDASASQPAAPVIQTVREDLDTVLSAQELPADAVEKLLTLFEAAVNARVAIEVARVEDEHEAALDEQTEALVDVLDGYVDYAAREFFTENEVAIENSLKIDLYEDFLDGLQDLFRKHWVEIPEDRVDVTAELADRVAELEEELNAKTLEALELEEAVLASRAAHVFGLATEGMTDADVEKLKTLVETVEFDGDEEDLADRIDTIKEAHFSPAKKATKSGNLNEGEGEIVTVTIREDGSETIESTDPAVASIAAAMSRMAKRRI